MIAAVLDTNVLAPGLTNRYGTSPPARLVEAWRERRAFDLYVSEHIMSELQTTLMNPYFRKRQTVAQISALLGLVRRRAVIIEINAPIQNVATHPEDDLILATAVTAQVDYLVTDDIKLQRVGAYQGVRIVSPRVFLAVLERGLE